MHKKLLPSRGFIAGPLESATETAISRRAYFMTVLSTGSKKRPARDLRDTGRRHQSSQLDYELIDDSAWKPKDSWGIQ